MGKGITKRLKIGARYVRRRVSGWRDQRGVSAIEFALIAPVLILAYVGTVETANLITVNRRVTQIASTAADLTAQVKEISNSDLQDIVKAASTILGPPYNSNPPKIVISSVVADKNNKGKVAWSYASTGTGRSANSSYTLPTGITEADSSVIVAEVAYDFKPMLGLDELFSPKAFQMNQTFYARPRKSFSVTKN